MSSPIVITQFQAENQDAVKDLILSGLADHWGQLDSTKNPDLDDIAASYANEVFLVAWQGDKIVGTGALVHRSDETGEIVRMSVAREMRRQGIGSLILQQLIERARSKGYCRVILETTKTWSEVIEFYLKLGFQITHEQNGEIYFKLDLIGK